MFESDTKYLTDIQVSKQTIQSKWCVHDKNIYIEFKRECFPDKYQNLREIIYQQNVTLNVKDFWIDIVTSKEDETTDYYIQFVKKTSKDPATPINYNVLEKLNLSVEVKAKLLNLNSLPNTCLLYYDFSRKIAYHLKVVNVNESNLTYNIKRCHLVSYQTKLFCEQGLHYYFEYYIRASLANKHTVPYHLLFLPVYDTRNIPLSEQEPTPRNSQKQKPKQSNKKSVTDVKEEVKVKNPQNKKEKKKT